MLLAWAQLMRLPNVFTAFADIALAACAVGFVTEMPVTFLLLLAASGCLYCGGMAWNDIFDREHDARTRPGRPIPSGRVSLGFARIFATMLIYVGIAFAGFACHWHFQISMSNSLFVAVLLAVAIACYDGWLKATPIGPVAMGACRFLNIYLGLSGNRGELSEEASFHLAATIGLYIVGVTLFARTEEGRSEKRMLILAWLVILAVTALALLIPNQRPTGATPFYAPYLVIAWFLWINWKLSAAIRQPEPLNVQAAVKRCILGLILLDAALATVFVGWPGLLIALFLIPAAGLGQWLYST